MGRRKWGEIIGKTPEKLAFGFLLLNLEADLHSLLVWTVSVLYIFDGVGLENGTGLRAEKKQDVCRSGSLAQTRISTNHTLTILSLSCTN